MPPLRDKPRYERPVSCRFCRSRKLRCSRESPCSNCVSRAMVCELPLPAENYSSSSSSASAAIQSATHTGVPSPIPNPNGAPPNISVSQPELLERIRKLEAIVATSQKSSSNGTWSDVDDIRRQRQHATQSRESFGGAHNGVTPRTPQTHRSRSIWSPEGEGEGERLNDDVTWLKSLYTAQDHAGDSVPSSKIAFRVCPIQQITQAPPYIDPDVRVPRSSTPGQPPLRCVWLPQYAEAQILLQKFTDDIDHVHHVTHSPSLPAVLNEVYAALNQNSPVQPGNILLFLGIFASATHTWVQRDSIRSLFPTCQEANAQALVWVRAVEDVLDIFHRTSSVPLEGIQGISIAIFTVLDMEGFSLRCKSLFNMALMLARELGLHSLDQPSNSNLANSARTELGRRLWWHLVAADWSLPSRRFNCGSQNIYNCHPRHMIVRKPLNINDEDVTDGMRCIERPLSQPTTMSFQLLQLSLSEISHNMADRSPLVMGLAGGLSHDVLMNIDTELQILLNDTPRFFSMSKEELISHYQLEPLRASHIVHQGYMFYSLLYAQRCTLHVAYFTRGLTEPAYAASSQICLQSARLVIQVESLLGKSQISAARYKFLGFLVPVFMASIVLLMELCHNKTSSHHAKYREELTEAVQILEEAKHESRTAAKFLDSLMQVLYKHEVSPTSKPSAEQLLMTPNGPPLMMGPQSLGEYPLPTSNSSMPGCSFFFMANEMFANGNDLSTYFNGLAQSFAQEIEGGTLDWNDMFSGIDSSMIWV